MCNSVGALGTILAEVYVFLSDKWPCPVGIRPADVSERGRGFEQ